MRAPAPSGRRARAGARRRGRPLKGSSSSSSLITTGPRPPPRDALRLRRLEARGCLRARLGVLRRGGGGGANAASTCAAAFSSSSASSPSRIASSVSARTRSVCNESRSRPRRRPRRRRRRSTARRQRVDRLGAHRAVRRAEHVAHRVAVSPRPARPSLSSSSASRHSSLVSARARAGTSCRRRTARRDAEQPAGCRTRPRRRRRRRRAEGTKSSRATKRATPPPPTRRACAPASPSRRRRRRRRRATPAGLGFSRPLRSSSTSLEAARRVVVARAQRGAARRSAPCTGRARAPGARLAAEQRAAEMPLERKPPCPP